MTQYEKQLLELLWQVVREGAQVKLLAQEKEVYVLAQSADRVNKERAMRTTSWPEIQKKSIPLE